MEEESLNIEAIVAAVFWIVLLLLFFYYGYKNDFKFRKRESIYNVTWVLLALIAFIFGYFYLALITGVLGGMLKPIIYSYLDDRKKE